MTGSLWGKVGAERYAIYGNRRGAVETILGQSMIDLVSYCRLLQETHDPC